MSKIGKKPITIPENVQITTSGNSVIIKGPKGELTVTLNPKIKAEQSQNQLIISADNSLERRQRALWGTMRALLQNAVLGVKSGFEKKLEIRGVGYKAQISGNKLVLNVGYSHPVELEIPNGLSLGMEKNIITVSGIDKQQVGEFAATIRRARPPEPYKGKGIKYEDEVVRRKAGKVVKAVGS